MNLSRGRQSYAQVLFSRERVPISPFAPKGDCYCGLIQPPILQMGKPRPRAGMPYQCHPVSWWRHMGPYFCPEDLSAVRGHTPLQLQKQAGN